MMRAVSFAVFALFTLWSGAGFAYVGPGAGLTMLGALWAVFAAIGLTLAGLLFWPLRAIVRRRRAGQRKATPPSGASHERR